MTTAVAEKETAVKAEQNGHLTQADEYRREVAVDLAHARRELRDAWRNVIDLTGDLKDAKERHKAAQIRVNDLSEHILDIENGCYTPTLPFERNGSANGKPKDAPVDEGAAMPIGALAEHGLTEKQCEKIAESKLEIKTVGDLEKAMRENEWWHRDIKGIGKETIDKVSDALLKFRSQHPIPVPEDTAEEQQAELAAATGTTDDAEESEA